MLYPLENLHDLMVLVCSVSTERRKNAFEYLLPHRLGNDPERGCGIVRYLENPEYCNFKSIPMFRGSFTRAWQGDWRICHNLNFALLRG
jgi:hypothetical protein